MIKITDNKKLIAIAGGALSAVVIIGAVFIIIINSKDDESVVYKETAVEYGDLTVGITEDSTVSIGTLEQVFDLDISALVSSSSGTSSSGTSTGMAAGGGMMGGSGGGGMMSFDFGGNQYTSQAQEMEIEAVNISVGQQINEGDVLYTLTEDSVNDIRTQLSQDVDDTLSEYETLQVEQQESRVSATQEYDTLVVNGKYAQLVYDNTILKLQAAVDDAQEDVTEKQNQYNENLEELQKLNEELASANKDLKDAEAAVEDNYANRYNDAYYYVTYENTREMAQKIVDTLEDDIEKLTEENENLSAQIDEAVRAYNTACRDLEKGKLDAKKTLDTDNYYAGVSGEYYSIMTASLDNDKQTALDSYNSAVEKLAEFDSYIVDNQVISEYSGVVTDVPLEVSDTIGQYTTLVSLYDKDDVTMEISISEDDYNTIDRDGQVNISYTAYPDVIYSGKITDVSDAEYDSDTGLLYYTLTITVQGDVSGLYEGMTGDVTLVTKETKEVNYVSNRAIFRDGTRSYVKVKDESGKVVEKDVVTGFSDGVNVEIVEGLSEGDIVLIESKVSD
jgi:HlyD family secretion protein